MSDNWRKKTYYEHRVLVPTADVLDNPYPDIYLCLTGGQAALVRYLLRYATWHSTFVSQYEQSFYLCPTNEEWDEIQATVADLEEKLMPCDSLATAIQNIADALACICSVLPTISAGGSPYTPLTPGIIDGYIEDGVLVYNDPYAGGETVVDEDRCAIANLAWQFAWELLTERIQPAQDGTLEALIPGLTAFIGFIIGGPVVAAPAGGVALYITQLIAVWVAQEQANVENAYFGYRDELVCAVYGGLATSTAAAAAAAAVIIDEMEELSPIDKALMKTSFAAWVLHFIGAAWTAQTDWALGYSDHTDCEQCEPTPPGVVCDDPITPGRYTGSFTVEDGAMVMGCGPGHPNCPEADTFVSGEFANTYEGNHRIKGEVFYHSGFNYGATVGGIVLQGYNDGMEAWQNLNIVTAVTLGDAQTDQTNVNDSQDYIDMSSYSLLRVAGNSQPAACKEDPECAFNLTGLCFTLTPQA